MGAVHLDGDWEKLLKNHPTVREAVHKAALGMADRVEAQHIRVGDTTADGFENIIDVPVDITTDGNVIIAHPAGEAVQAKYGALTKAAAALGLQAGHDG